MNQREVLCISFCFFEAESYVAQVGFELAEGDFKLLFLLLPYSGITTPDFLSLTLIGHVHRGMQE